MTAWRWPPATPPRHLGAVVHGPVLLSRAKDVAAGLRCVWAHPEGLWLPLVVQARGVHAEAAVRRSFDRTGAGDPPHAGLGVGLRLVVGVGDRTGIAEALGGSSSGGDDDFTSEPHYWVGDLPRDGVLRVGVSWPEVGLPETQTTLCLEGLADLAGRVIHLLPSARDQDAPGGQW